MHPFHRLQVRSRLLSALWLVLVGGAALMVLQFRMDVPPVAGLAAAPAQRTILVFEDPTPQLLEQLYTDARVDVRWVETGLVVAEVDAARIGGLGGRVVGTRRLDRSLGILRAADRQRLQGFGSEVVAARQFVQAHAMATARAAAGPVTILLATPGSWPEELLGCHGGLVVAPHGVDPRTLLDQGPPEELRPWVEAARPLRARHQDILAAVSAETLQVYWDGLRRSPIGLPADRWAYSTEMAVYHVPRLQALMQRLVQGIPGAVVELQGFDIQRRTPGDPPDTLDVTTHNVIARIPGVVPGTGTFVVGGHVDATGSRSTQWLQNKVDGIAIETPGAEDNATGVACALEMLRNIADAVRADSIAFAFDLEFIAFGAEESQSTVGGLQAPLTGSMHYVDQRRQAGTKLLGIFNLDMVGSDSLLNNLQIVHNNASTWMVPFITGAVAQVTPDTIDISLTPELDEALASDHNSFWIAGTDGVLGADAPVDVLRRYASYHRPTDTGGDVRVDKMREVTRAFLAALLQFDTGVPVEPDIVFPPEKLRLRIQRSGGEFTYIPSFHTLVPGDTTLKAEMAYYNLGATMSDTVQVSMQTQVGNGSPTTVLDTLIVQTLPTGGRVDVRLDPVPLLVAGDQTLVAHLTTRNAGGGLETQTSSIDYVVQPGATTSAAPVLGPNPVADLSETRVTAATGEDGTLEVNVYTLEGAKIASSRRSVTAAAMANGDVEVLDPATTRPRVVSGTYLVEVRWSGATTAFHEVLTAVVVR